MRFNYAEFDGAGNTLDKELGGIAGLSFNVAQRLSAWELEERASYHYGRVPYIGQTQAGVPYNTDTNEGVGDVALRVGRWFMGEGRLMPYAGLGYRRWDRDILPGTLGGLSESYRWKYTWVGAKILAYRHDESSLTLDIGWIKPIAPKMQVDFKGAYNISPTLDLGSRDGLRLMLTSRLALDKHAMLILEPYYEYWQLGRSPLVTTGGISVYEPASKTKNLGVNVRLGWKF